MVYPFQHNNALEPANPHRGASGAVWRGSRREPNGSLARPRWEIYASSPSHVPPRTARQTLLAGSKISLCSIFNAASARSAQLVYRRHFSANPFGFAAQRGVRQAKILPIRSC